VFMRFSQKLNDSNDPVRRSWTPQRQTSQRETGLHQTQLCLGWGGRTVDAEALGAVPAGHSIVALSVRCQIGRTGLIGDERVTSHLLSPPPLEPDQRVQGKVRNLEHSVATGPPGFPRAAHCLSLLCALANLIGLAALVHETH
jgi:hypothetical protein